MRQLIIELRQSGHTIIMASHLLDEVEKFCTHVAILRTGDLLITGEVDEILMADDVVELSAPDLNALSNVLQSVGKNISIDNKLNVVHLTLPKGTARPEEINRLCFQNGIVLNHLIMKKKKLEARFFELTSN
jgi:ABC-2 type transport system ATP-binding protein